MEGGDRSGASIKDQVHVSVWGDLSGSVALGFEKAGFAIESLIGSAPGVIECNRPEWTGLIHKPGKAGVIVVVNPMTLSPVSSAIHESPEWLVIFSDGEFCKRGVSKTRKKPKTPEEAEGSFVRRIDLLLSTGGYKNTFLVYDASYFGVPQGLEVFVLLARKGAQEDPLLPEPPGTTPKTPRALFLGMDPKGLVWCKSCSTKTILLEWDKVPPSLPPSPRIGARILHPDGSRILAVQEYHRLWGLPETWKFGDALTLDGVYECIGRSVPPQVAEKVAHAIVSQPQRFDPDCKGVIPWTVKQRVFYSYFSRIKRLS